MPRLVRLYIRHCTIGFALAGLFVAALLALNVANLGHLAQATAGGRIAVALLLLFNGLVFAGVQFAIAVMRMQEAPLPPRGGLPAVPFPAPVPAPVPAAHR